MVRKFANPFTFGHSNGYFFPIINASQRFFSHLKWLLKASNGLLTTGEAIKTKKEEETKTRIKHLILKSD